MPHFVVRYSPPIKSGGVSIRITCCPTLSPLKVIASLLLGFGGTDVYLNGLPSHDTVNDMVTKTFTCCGCGTLVTKTMTTRKGQTRFSANLCKSVFEKGRHRIDQSRYRLKYRYVTRNNKPMGEHRWVMEQVLPPFAHP